MAWMYSMPAQIGRGGRKYRLGTSANQDEAEEHTAVLPGRIMSAGVRSPAPLVQHLHNKEKSK
jgi:hypothetical protein